MNEEKGLNQIPHRYLRNIKFYFFFCFACSLDRFVLFSATNSIIPYDLPHFCWNLPWSSPFTEDAKAIELKSHMFRLQNSASNFRNSRQVCRWWDRVCRLLNLRSRCWHPARQAIRSPPVSSFLIEGSIHLSRYILRDIEIATMRCHKQHGGLVTTLSVY